MLESNSEIIFYRAEDGTTKIDVRLEKETVWLNQVQMAALFQTTKQNISLHINNLFEEGELNREASVKDYLTVQIEGKRDVSRSIDQYLSFAELQAMQRKSMTMQDWINKLHDFLTINERTVLMDAGRIQKKIGEEIALKELVKYQEIQKQKELENPSSDFDKAVKKLTERKK